MNPIISTKALTAICLTSLISLCALPNVVLAESPKQSPRQGLPGRRVGGGTRGGDQPLSATPLTALIPENNLALTVAESPKLFFYLPKFANQQQVEFILNDANEETVYETTFMTPNNSGVISLSLPASTTKSLEIGKNYHWYLSIINSSGDRAADISVDGWIQRSQATPAIVAKLKNLSPLKRADLYVANNLWSDALATVADLRLSRPKDAAITAKWAQLLQSVKLDKLAKEPLVQYQLSKQQPTPIQSENRL